MKTALKIVSVLQLICGVLVLIIGLGAIGLFTASDAPAAVVGAMVTLSVVVLLVGGVLDVISGVLGLRAANDSAKATPAVVFGLLAVISSAISLFLSFNVTSLLACVIPVIYFVCALGISSRRS